MLLLFWVATGQKKYFLLVGTYTSGYSNGIYVYDFNTVDATTRLVDSIATSNPSYLAVSPDQTTIYSVNEDAEKGIGGRITAFSIDRSNGHMKEMSTASSMGDHPCYVAVDKTGKWVMAGNYSSGTAALYSVDKNRNVWIRSSMNLNESKENKDKKKIAHVHATVFSKDNRFVFIPDLGSDKIWIQKFDASTGHIEAAPVPFVRLPDSSGPRHFDFHPSNKWAYVIQELTGTVTAFSYSNGQLHQIQSMSSLPLTYRGPARSADIHISHDGKFLYASNRDPSNNIAIFSINPQSGLLTLVSHQSTLGKTPRNFNFDPTGNFLLVANQNSNNIVVFRVDRTTGLLTDTGKRIDVGNPVCVKWVER